MKTLEQAIVESKCRKGKADGTNKHGAFWLACMPIVIRRAGGDGIGNGAPDITFTLLLRHYRNGTAQAVVRRNAWHQNGTWSGSGTNYASLGKGFLASASVEDVVVALKASGFGDTGETCYSDSKYDDLLSALAALGLIEAPPSPDEEDPETAA